MQDSSITITVTAVDGATKVFEGIGTSAVKQASKAAAAWQEANDVANVSISSTEGSADATNKASKAQDNLTASTKRSYFAQTALTTILSAGINKAFLTMVDVTGQAIQRVDLIANFPKTMESLGISATDASAALSKLSSYVASVGGNLQDATTTVTRFAETTHNVSAATAEFEGVSNALIAGGASSDVQANALEQLTQAYSRGVPQLIEYKSLLVAMPAQLNEVAEALKLPNAQALGTELTTGKISMQTFMTELTKLGTGTGIIAQQANAHLSGIQFGFNQFKNTLVTGMTEVIQAIGRQNIVAFLSLITSTVKQLAAWAVDLIGILFTLFNTISQVFGGPQLKLASDSTAGIASNLADSADDAGDLANNLGDAGDAAAKTADQLAGFDKMNVLTSPDTSGGSGSGDTSGVGASGLSPSDASTLDGIFSDMAAQMQKITGAAKILAGIIASLAGIKFAQGLLNQVNGLISTIKEAQSNFNTFKKALLGGTDESGKQVDGLAQKIGKLGSSVGVSLGGLAEAIVGAFELVFSTAGKKIFLPLVSAAAEAGAAILEGFALVGAIVAEILLLPEELALGVLIAIGVAVVAVIAGIGLLIAKNWSTIVTAVETALSAMYNFFVGIFDDIATFVTGVWNTLYAILSGPFTFIEQFLYEIFIVILAVVAIFVQGVVELFIGLVAGIFVVLSAIAGWIYDNVITPVVNFFTAMWQLLVALATAFFNAVLSVLLPIAGWVNANIIQPVIGFFSGMWNAISGFTVGFFNGLVNILSPFASWVNVHVIQPVLNFFSSLWGDIEGGFQNMINAIGSIFGQLGSIVKAPFNALIDTLNDFFGSLGGLTVPSWVPHFGGDKVSFPKIPHLATGGIVSAPTLALVGESGPEAVMPLQNNTEWIDLLADKINSSGGTSTGQPVSLTVQIGEDKIATKLINLINEKTQMSGRNTVLV